MIDEPVLVPLSVRVLVNSQCEIEEVVFGDDPITVPFGGGTYDATLLPNECGPLVMYPKRPFPAWIMEELDNAGIDSASITLIVLARSVAECPSGLALIWPSVHILSVPSYGVLFVFRSE